MGNITFKRLVAKPRKGRGSLDPVSILQAITDNWESVKKNLNEYPDADKATIIAHFNGLIGEADEYSLGDAMFEVTKDENGKEIIRAKSTCDDF